MACTIASDFSPPASCSSLWSPSIPSLAPGRTALYLFRFNNFHDIGTTSAGQTSYFLDFLDDPGQESCLPPRSFPNGTDCYFSYSRAVCPTGYKAFSTAIGPSEVGTIVQTFTTEFCCPSQTEFTELSTGVTYPGSSPLPAIYCLGEHSGDPSEGGITFVNASSTSSFLVGSSGWVSYIARAFEAVHTGSDIISPYTTTGATPASSAVLPPESATATALNQKTGNRGLSAGALAGIAAGSAIGGVIALSIIYLFWRRRSSRKEGPEAHHWGKAELEGLSAEKGKTIHEAPNGEVHELDAYNRPVEMETEIDRQSLAR